MIRYALMTMTICLCLILSASFNILADDGVRAVPEQDKTAALIDLLLKKGIITEEEAEAFKEQFIYAAPVTTPDQVAVEKEKAMQQEITRVEEKLDNMTDALLQKDRLAERHRDEIVKRIDDDIIGKLYKSSWAQKIKIDGDVRLRYQGDLYDKENGDFLKPDDPTSLMNTTTDRHRFRYRARLGLKAAIIDDRELNVGKVEAGFRLATGNDKDPISTNDTMGDYYNKDNILFDRAYLKWSYKPIMPVWNKIPGASFTAGRMKNPWFSTNLVWDSDLNFEGFAVNLQSDTQDFANWRSSLTMGVFPLQEEEFSRRDKWLYGVQLGLVVKPRYDCKMSWGLAYYDYRNVEGVVNDPLLPGIYDFTAPLYQQKGNTLIDIDPSTDIKTALAADYNLLNFTSKFDITTFFPIHAVIEADFVANLGFDKDKVEQRTGIEDISEDVMGYQIGAKIGYPVIYQFGEWNTSLYYRYLGSDAVIDAFTDSDFHNGGTNAKGWVFGLEYGIYKNMWLAFKWLTSDEIDGPPLMIDTAQIDLNARF